MTKLVIIDSHLYSSPDDSVLLQSFASDVIPLPNDNLTKEQILAYGHVSMGPGQV